MDGIICLSVGFSLSLKSLQSTLQLKSWIILSLMLCWTMENIILME